MSVRSRRFRWGAALVASSIVFAAACSAFSAAVTSVMALPGEPDWRDESFA